MKRAERRHAEQVKKAKVKRIVKETWYHNPQARADSSLAENEKFIGKMAATHHPCSCRCCGNPRKYAKGKDGLTMQELRELEKEMRQ